MSACTDLNGDRWEFYQSGGWRWRRTARNGNIVGASTEAYHNYVDCVANARRHGMACNPV